MTSAMPGTNRNQGSTRYQLPDWAALSICPQDGVGSLTPTPRKERAASAEMFVGIIMVAYTSTTPDTFGMTWVNRIVRLDAP